MSKAVNPTPTLGSPAASSSSTIIGRAADDTGCRSVEDITARRENVAGLRLLVVDDERAIRAACETIATSIGYSTTGAQSGDEALRVLSAQPVDAVLMDLRMPGMNGLEALDKIRAKFPDMVVVMMTGYGSIESAVEAMKKGAYDYITKPFHVEELRVLLRRIDKHLQLTAENRILREQLQATGGFGLMVGRSPEMQKLFRVAARAAFSTHPVLIVGAPGTGKELLARSIHISGPSREKPFIPIDCGSLAPALMEPELFGEVREGGTSKQGVLAMAEGGTLFLDEIVDLPLEIQAKLLRAIQEKEVRPIGSNKPVAINVRILAATSRDLERAVEEGNFRQDLYFRLNVLTVRIPALSERKEDVPVLAGHFLERIAQETGVRQTFSDEALKKMMEYLWPGNVRELENCVERACTLATGPLIRIPDLPPAIQDWKPAEVESPKPKMETLADIEKHAILSTIEKMNGDKLKAARALGIGRTTLYRKLSEYELE